MVYLGVYCCCWQQCSQGGVGLMDGSFATTFSTVDGIGGCISMARVCATVKEIKEGATNADAIAIPEVVDRLLFVPVYVSAVGTF